MVIADIMSVQLAQAEGQLAADSQESSANKPQFKPGDMKALGKANATRQEQIAARRQVVLTRIKQGETLKKIADDLGVGYSTVKGDKRALNGQLKGVK